MTITINATFSYNSQNSLLASILNAVAPSTFTPPGSLPATYINNGVTHNYVAGGVRDNDTDFGALSNVYYFNYNDPADAGYGLGAMLTVLDEATGGNNAGTDNEIIKGVLVNGSDANTISGFTYIDGVVTINNGLYELPNYSDQYWVLGGPTQWTMTGASWNVNTFYNAGAAARAGNYTAIYQLLDAESYIFNGSNAADSFTGGNLADLITGGDGADQLYGYAGDDYFYDNGSSDGADTYDGGSGFNTVIFTGTTGVVVVDGSTYAGNTMINIQGFVGTTAADIFDLSDTDGIGNRIDGGEGSDIIEGGSGNDLVYAEGGSDRVTVGIGFDIVDGGAGTDTLWMRDGSAISRIWVVDIAAGVAQLSGAGSGTLVASAIFSGFERYFGADSAFQNSFLGTSNADEVSGGDDTTNLYSAGLGSDIVNGRASSYDIMTMASSLSISIGGGLTSTIFNGNDTINMGTGIATRMTKYPASAFVTETTTFSSIERVNAGDGNDSVTGAGGNDYIYGGAGNDGITGGFGTNTIVGEGGTDTALYFTSSLGATRTQTSNGGWTISGIAGGNAYSDNLTGVERIYFSSNNKTIQLREDGRADFNGDGTSDMVLQSGNTVVSWTLSGGVYKSGSVLSSNTGGFSVVGKGDINADGTTDLILQSGGSVVSWTMRDGAYQLGNTITTGANGYKVVAVGDLDGDLDADLVLQNGGTVVAWKMQGGVYQSGTVLTTTATGFTVVGAGDLDGDGDTDLVLQNGATVVDWIMQNGAYQSGNVLSTTATGFTVRGVGDFNGDGVSDIVLQNGATVVDWIMQNGVYQTGNVITTGAVGATVVGTGDFNNDGTTDISLQNGGTIVDWIMKAGLYQSGNIITTGATGYTVM